MSQNPAEILQPKEIICVLGERAGNYGIKVPVAEQLRVVKINFTAIRILRLLANSQFSEIRNLLNLLI